MTVEEEIDRLYQLPLGSFTGEREALAKRAGGQAAEIRRLQKPTVAAWAVNQVYWHKRKMYDRLQTAAERLRDAHERQLSGKSADVAHAEATHEATLKAAVDEARELLERSGDHATPATLANVGDTFRTLAWKPLDGRLVQPRKPSGLEAIAGLMQGPRVKTPRTAEVVPFRPLRPDAEEKAEAAKREAEERRRQRAALEKDLAQASAAEQRAEAELVRAQAALDKAAAEHARLSAAAEKAAAVTNEKRKAAHDAKERLQAATVARQQLQELKDRA